MKDYEISALTENFLAMSRREGPSVFLNNCLYLLLPGCDVALLLKESKYGIVNERGNKVFNRVVEDDLSPDALIATFTNKSSYTRKTLFIISLRR